MPYAPALFRPRAGTVCLKLCLDCTVCFEQGLWNADWCVNRTAYYTNSTNVKFYTLVWLSKNEMPCATWCRNRNLFVLIIIIITMDANRLVYLMYFFRQDWKNSSETSERSWTSAKCHKIPDEMSQDMVQNWRQSVTCWLAVQAYCKWGDATGQSGRGMLCPFWTIQSLGSAHQELHTVL